MESLDAARFSAHFPGKSARSPAPADCAGPTGLPAREISDRLAIPPSTMSFHLSALERVGLIFATRQGRQIIYALRVLALRQLLGFFDRSLLRATGTLRRSCDPAAAFPTRAIR